jgi:glycosyltransferase involved in cell wall biosynthesis
VFTDFINEGELRWLYEHSAAYVFPSLSEGFGLPGLEAMIHGTPVVSSDATCLPEVYGDAAHYFDPRDVRDMAAKISDVLTDSKLRQDLIKKGTAQAAKYSWQRMAEQTLEIYSKFGT